VSHTLDSYVDFLLEFVQALGLRNLSIFGESVGGTLAWLCGVKSPEQFDKLMVRCPLWSSKQLPGYLQNTQLISVHHHLSGNPLYARFALSLFYNISARMSPVDKKDKKSPLPYEDGQVNPVVLNRFLGHLVQVEFEDALNSLPNETLVLWGALDSFVSSAWGRYLSQILPVSQYLEMPGEYHNIATTDPKIMAKHISIFVVG
jgi:pimeloyl-ACP methyl ester carboxylesterase